MMCSRATSMDRMLDATHAHKLTDIPTMDSLYDSQVLECNSERSKTPINCIHCHTSSIFTFHKNVICSPKYVVLFCCMEYIACTLDAYTVCTTTDEDTGIN